MGRGTMHAPCPPGIGIGIGIGTGTGTGKQISMAPPDACGEDRSERYVRHDN